MAGPFYWHGSTVQTGRGAILKRIYDFFVSAAACWEIIDVSDVAHFATEAATAAQSKLAGGAWFVVRQVKAFYSTKHQEIFFGVRDTSSAGTLAGFSDVTIAKGLWAVYGPDGGWDSVANNFGSALNTANNVGVSQFDILVGNFDAMVTQDGNDPWYLWVPDTWNDTKAAEIWLYADEDTIAGRMRNAATVGYDSAGFEIGAMIPSNPDNVRPAVFMCGPPRLITITGNHYGWDDTGAGHCLCRCPNAAWTNWNLVNLEVRTLIDTYALAEDGTWFNDNLYVYDRTEICQRGILRLFKRAAHSIPYGTISSPLGTRIKGDTMTFPRVP